MIYRCSSYLQKTTNTPTLNGGGRGGVRIVLFSNVTLFEYNVSAILSPIVGPRSKKSPSPSMTLVTSQLIPQALQIANYDYKSEHWFAGASTQGRFLDFAVLFDLKLCSKWQNLPSLPLLLSTQKACSHPPTVRSGPAFVPTRAQIAAVEAGLKGPACLKIFQVI